MNKITLHLTKSEWQQLAATVLTESANSEHIEDKYMKAILSPLLKQVYVKLHNKLHSLDWAKNRLNLTLPEASVLGSALLELNSNSYIITSITGIIDQKLT
ncbi:MAG: hypothetical protein Q7U54_07960 [Bacteroidales bacterium]|nr:hypothetical protein [Bacteroidales bacterium]